MLYYFLFWGLYWRFVLLPFTFLLLLRIRFDDCDSFDVARVDRAVLKLQIGFEIEAAVLHIVGVFLDDRCRRRY